MSYEAAIKETDFALLSEHNKNQLSPDNAWIVTENRKQEDLRDTLTFFQDATLAELKGFFQMVASPPDDGKGKWILIHAINPDDDIQNTNSKLPWLHTHFFTADFAKEFSHISDPEIKSAVVTPNPSLGHAIHSSAQSQNAGDNFVTFRLPAEDVASELRGEAKHHDILVHPGFSNFQNFADCANDQDWEYFRENMISLIKPAVADGAGGMRIIIDDRNIKTEMFCIQGLWGENLDRFDSQKSTKSKRQRYFEAPSF